MLLTVNAVAVCGTVDSAIRHELEIAILEEHLYGARRACDVAEVGGALRARLGGGGWGGGGGGGARGQRQRREEQPQRARARRHGAPRPWQPPGRRHCTTPSLIPRTTAPLVCLYFAQKYLKSFAVRKLSDLAPDEGLLNYNQFA